MDGSVYITVSSSATQGIVQFLRVRPVSAVDSEGAFDEFQGRAEVFFCVELRDVLIGDVLLVRRCA